MLLPNAQACKAIIHMPDNFLAGVKIASIASGVGPHTPCGAAVRRAACIHAIDSPMDSPRLEPSGSPAFRLFT